MGRVDLGAGLGHGWQGDGWSGAPMRRIPEGEGRWPRVVAQPGRGGVLIPCDIPGFLLREDQQRSFRHRSALLSHPSWPRQKTFLYGNGVDPSGRTLLGPAVPLTVWAWVRRKKSSKDDISNGYY